MCVIDVPDELIAIHALGLTRSGKQSLSTDNIDIIWIQKNQHKIKKLYFDISTMRTNESPKNILFHQFYHAYLNYYCPEFKIE